MKILMLTPYLPYPLLSGGQIRSFNLLRKLSKKHEITLFSFIRNQEETKYKTELLKFCKEVKMFRRRPAWSWINILLSGFSAYPFLVSIYYSRSLKKAIASELKKENFDLIHSETFYVMPNIPKTDVPVLLAEQTIEYLVYKHFVNTVKFLPLKLLLNLDVLKIKFWEKYFWKKAKKVVAMSEADKKVMLDLVPELPVSIVPNGVDTDLFFKIKRKASQIPTVLFVGNFKWLQNREAVDELVQKVWPEIRKKFSKIKLWIVGRYPSPEIQAYQNQEITVSSDIDDIKKVYAESDVLLAPIYGPGGTRYKILEAMASGLPVVTTSCGIEGLGAVDGVHAIFGDGPKELAAQTINVLSNEKLRQKLVENGKNLIKADYDWAIIANHLDMLYQQVSARK